MSDLSLISIQEIDCEDFLTNLYCHPNIKPYYFSEVIRPVDEEGARDYAIALKAWELYNGFILSYKGEFVGDIGISEGFINIALLPEFQGLGIAKQAIRTIMEKYPRKEYTATILPDNIASIGLFQSLGFVETGYNDYYKMKVFTLES